MKYEMKIRTGDEVSSIKDRVLAVKKAVWKIQRYNRNLRPKSNTSTLLYFSTTEMRYRGPYHAKSNLFPATSAIPGL
jgi:hypothetical protein